jgi:hypothetical protein
VVALFTKLVAKGYVQPSLMLIEQRKADRHQMKIKGEYNIPQISMFFKNTKYYFEEDKNYLIIFKPL